MHHLIVGSKGTSRRQVRPKGNYAGLRTLKEGQKVSFEIVTDKRTGKTSAGNLKAS